MTNEQSSKRRKKSLYNELRRAAFWGIVLAIPIAVYASYHENQTLLEAKTLREEIAALDAACEQKAADTQKALDLKFVTENATYQVVCTDSNLKESCKLESKPHRSANQR